ncbi:MAG: transglycosylase SLT domain-containing protein [Burkholderiaceae bacterium]|nr:transglycosylase SLT domain-containing protein [Burkholderiaceae bacterium]
MFKHDTHGALAVRWPRMELALAARRMAASVLPAMVALALAGTTSVDTGFAGYAGHGGDDMAFGARDRAGSASLPAPGARSPELRPPAGKSGALGAEQNDVAQFIAERYRVALDQTRQFVDFAYRTARESRLDPLLILAVMSVESSFNPRAQSAQGAQGLMQVLTRVHLDKFAPFGGAAAAFDPLANIRVGARILSDYMRRDGTIEGALKGYVGAALLPDDGGYGRKVLDERELIARAAGRSDR